MSLRIFSGAIFALALAGCGSSDASPEPEGNTIDCAIGPGADFSSVCTLERMGEGAEFLIHHPDGGFRRLSFDRETLDWITLDGAAPVVKTEEYTSGSSLDGHFELQVEDDRYRITWVTLGESQ